MLNFVLEGENIYRSCCNYNNLTEKEFFFYVSREKNPGNLGKYSI